MTDFVLAIFMIAVGIFATVSGVLLFIVDAVREHKDVGYKTTGFMNAGVLLAGVLMLLFGIELVYESIAYTGLV